jgi:hypothetical protein
MTRDEFLSVMVTLAAGCGKPASAETHEVYWQLLGDLPEPAFRAAAAQALLESRYPVFPPVGTLRQLAVGAVQGAARLPSPAEAWGLVRRALVGCGYYRAEAGLASLPPAVRRTAECLGWQELCDATEPEIVRAQFCKAYEQVAGREEREALLPPKLRAALAQVGRLPGPYALSHKGPTDAA